MATPRRLALTAVLALPLVLSSSCDKKKDPGSVTPATTDATGPTPTRAGSDTKVVREPVAAEDKVNVVASIGHLDDVFEAVRLFGESYMPDTASDPMASLQAQLLAFGFGPGFLGHIDFSGNHVVATSFPAQGQGGPEDSDFAGSIAVKDGRKVIDSTPSAFRPQPLGEGMWEFTQDSIRMLIKEAGKELHVGMSVTDLDRAAKLQREFGEGRRIRIRATNIPVDGIDPAQVFDLPDIKIVRDFTKVLQSLEAVEVETQLGTKSDFEFITSAIAPFHKLGLDPLGKPRTAATDVEKVLPPDPVFVTSLSYGNPAMLHKVLDSAVPMSMVPEPFKEMATKTMGSVHGILDQVSKDVVFALYVDKKGQGTVVIAATVKNDAATLAALRALNEVGEAGVKLQQTMVGKSKDQAFEVSYKKGSVKLAGGASGDRFSVTVPSGFREDFRDAEIFVKKNAVDVTTMVHGGIAIVAIGAGGRDVVGQVASSVAKAPKDSLATDSGLAAVRRAMGGCQVCVAGGPSEYVRFRLLLVKGGSDDKELAVQADTKLKELAKLGALGLIGAGFKVEKQAASFGAVVPQSLMYADPKKVATLISLNDFLSGGGEEIVETRKPAAVPGRNRPGKQSRSKKAED